MSLIQHRVKMSKEVFPMLTLITCSLAVWLKEVFGDQSCVGDVAIETARLSHQTLVLLSPGIPWPQSRHIDTQSARFIVAFKDVAGNTCNFECELFVRFKRWLRKQSILKNNGKKQKLLKCAWPRMTPYDPVLTAR